MTSYNSASCTDITPRLNNPSFMLPNIIANKSELSFVVKTFYGIIFHVYILPWKANWNSRIDTSVVQETDLWNRVTFIFIFLYWFIIGTSFYLFRRPIITLRPSICLPVQASNLKMNGSERPKRLHWSCSFTWQSTSIQMIKSQT